MKADELIQQYQSGVITARKLVEGVWEECGEGPDPGGENLIWIPASDKGFRTWPAAAKFTISRIKEIRRVKEEIAQFTEILGTYAERNDWIRRILAREQSALAELSRGIRPEKL